MNGTSRKGAGYLRGCGITIYLLPPIVGSNKENQ